MGNFISSSAVGALKPEEEVSPVVVVEEEELPSKQRDVDSRRRSHNPATDDEDVDQLLRIKSRPGTFTPDTMDETHFHNNSLDNPADTETESRSKTDQDKVDPRVIHLLEFFRQMYVRKQDLFGKVIPSRIKDELVELLTKMGKAKELQVIINRQRHPHHHHHLHHPHLMRRRSFSMGATRGIDIGNSDLKMERFKVKTLDVPTGGGGGGGGTKAGGGGSK